MTKEPLPELEIETKDSVEFDDIMSFKVSRQLKKEYQKITGRKGAAHLRESMQRIIEQLSVEPEEKDS